MRSLLVASAGTAVFVALFTTASDSKACGGCFHEPPKPNETGTVVTDHRMIFSVSKTATTLYDQIHYQGDPAAFAWVLPIAGNVEVGLSADVLFGALDTLTETEITAPPRPFCPGPPYCGSYDHGGGGGGCGSSDSVQTYAPGAFAEDGGTAGGDAAYKAPPPVEVTKQEVVGPYETVQLKATDPTALENWLSTNGFMIPADVKPIIAAYQSEGFGFLALKLLPGKSVTSMRPVRVTTTGAGLALPLRMVAAGTGATVGITLWVVSEGRYEPQNFSWFRIDDSELVWDWNTSSSNYTKLRADKATAGMGAAWEVESSFDISRSSIQGIVLSGGKLAGGPTVAADSDYLPVTDPMNMSVIVKSADQVRQEDLDALLSGMSNIAGTVTRLRADLARDALAKDLNLTAAADQRPLTNKRQITNDVNRPVCPTYPPCPPEIQARGGGGCSAAADGASSAGLGIVTALIALSFGRRRKRA
jgi:hypothetical protein